MKLITKIPAHVRLFSNIKLLRRSPDAIILGIRLLGFAGTSVSFFYLGSIDNLGYDARLVALIFITYILYTTLLFVILGKWRSQNLFFTLLLLDMLTISSVYYFIQASGTIPTGLNPLYLAILTASSLLGERRTLLVGATALATYSIAHFANAPQFAAMFIPEYITRFVAFVFFTLAAVAQSYYFTYITRKRNEDALLLKDQFVFTTAHDLRAPFALIRLLADKYEKAEPKTLSHLQEDMVSINENITVASELLEDLLRLAKGDNIPSKKVPILLTPIIVSLLENWEPRMQENNVHYVYDEREGCIILGDEQKLRYVLDNLIDNAVKYNNPGGSIHIWHEIREKICKTLIEDTGRGIRKENLHKVFTPYFRELKDGGVPGAGLGLYGAKRFIEQMHGTIEVGSTENGTRFTISLPMYTVPK